MADVLLNYLFIHSKDALVDMNACLFCSVNVMGEGWSTALGCRTVMIVEFSRQAGMSVWV